MACLSDLARQIYFSLGEPEDVSIPVISYWISNIGIGKLNVLLDTCYSSDDNCEITPELCYQEAAILSTLYAVEYIGRQSKKYMGAGAYTEEVIRFKEGNRDTQLNPKTNNAKLLLEYLRELKDELNQLIISYKMNGAGPRQAIVNLGCDCYGFGSVLPWYEWRSRNFLF